MAAGAKTTPARLQPTLGKRIRRDLSRYKYVYIMLIPIVVWYILFCYRPLLGNVIAFKDYKASKGIWGSPWVGIKHFTAFFSSFYFWRVLRNTLLISLYGIIFSFPAPILLALLMNEMHSRWYKSTVQTITYMPYFISMIVICGMLMDFLKMDGVITTILAVLGMPNENYLMKPEAFRTIYVASDIWQNCGWNSIIYMAALSSIDQELYEAAAIDGANRFKQTLHVTLPGLLPTIMILLIIRIGAVLNVGYEKIILLYNSANADTSDVISSFVYRYGMQKGNYSYATAVGLFNSLFNFILLVAVNAFSRKVSEISLW